MSGKLIEALDLQCAGGGFCFYIKQKSDLLGSLECFLGYLLLYTLYPVGIKTAKVTTQAIISNMFNWFYWFGYDDESKTYILHNVK